jgi:anthranilate synthase component 2
MNILLIDNYDSFTYNLVHLIEKSGYPSITVVKNDAITLAEVNHYDKILLSPGPGLPKDAGIMPQLIKTYFKTKSIFGVCLGMQAIGEAFGCQLKNLDTVMHGIKTPIHIIQNDTLFENCPRELNVGRYHSWVVDKNKLSEQIEVTAIDDQGEIMAIKHRTYDVKGVQFHPESILTEHGEQIISNWLKY